MEYRGVIPQDLAIGALWLQIGALIATALPYGRGEYTIDDIRDGIRDGEMFAIGVVKDATVRFVATCTVSQFPRKRVLYVQYGAGRGAADTEATLLDAARTLGCDWIETRCRTSVARLYRRHGFDIGYCVPILEVPA